MNQEQFASALGTTVASVNRWENGKSLPSQMAQTNLYHFCDSHGIDAADIVVETFLYEPEGDDDSNSNSNGDHGISGSRSINSDNDSNESGDLVADKCVFYHGSKSGIVGDIAPISREECDFGPGFYMGTNALQPLTLVCAEDRPKFYVLEFDLSGLRIFQMKIDLDWAMTIAYHRGQMESAKGTPVYEKYAHMLDGYDVATGFIADDRMYAELARFFDGTITDVALLNCLSALDLGMQYVAITQRACDRIAVLAERNLHLLERLLLQDKSAKRRAEGIALADEAVKRHRREGRYFDEILEGVET